MTVGEARAELELAMQRTELRALVDALIAAVRTERPLVMLAGGRRAGKRTAQASDAQRRADFAAGWAARAGLAVGALAFEGKGIDEYEQQAIEDAVAAYLAQDVEG